MNGCKQCTKVGILSCQHLAIKHNGKRISTVYKDNEQNCHGNVIINTCLKVRGDIY